MALCLGLLFAFSAVCVTPVFFFNDTATTEIYTLSLHDALPIFAGHKKFAIAQTDDRRRSHAGGDEDRKSTRLNSSHQIISYAVFCLKKKKRNEKPDGF